MHCLLVLNASPIAKGKDHIPLLTQPNPDAFITTWRTVEQNETIVIPVNPSSSFVYDYSVDWGDGSTSDNQTSHATHTYVDAGEHIVSITGQFPTIQFSSDGSSADNNAKLLTVNQWGTSEWSGMDAAFQGCINLTTVPNGPGPIFAPNSTLYCMFMDCSSFNADLNLWDMHNVRETSFMFFRAKVFNGDISSWDVSNVTNMQNMFKLAVDFNGDIGDWDVSKVKLMDQMFYGAEAFNGALNEWDVSQVTDMFGMFEYAFAFDQSLGSWQIGAVMKMERMLAGSHLSPFNYESTLTGWAAQSIQSGIVLDADGLKFCASSSRNALINNNNWSIRGDRQVCLVMAQPDGDGIVYVDSSNSAPGDGSSWGNALTYLSNAIESARINSDIKAIYVAKGTYYPAGDSNLLFRDSSFILNRSGLELLGGFPSGGGTRNMNENTTILSGENGLRDSVNDNNYHVLIVLNIPAGADSLIVDGFDVTKGYSSNDQNDNDLSLGIIAGVGGIMVSNVARNTVIRNCRIYENRGFAGAGMGIAGPFEDGPETVENLTGPLITNCLFKSNHATSGQSIGVLGEGIGGALLTALSAPIFQNCRFIENEAMIGGALANALFGTPIFIGSTFSGNKSWSVSTLYNIQFGHCIFANCLITDNVTIGTPGDGDSSELGSDILNTMMVNAYASSIRIINSTISGNHGMSASAKGNGFVNILQSNLWVTNSVIWGNQNSNILDSTGSSSKLAYSLIEGLPGDADNHLLDGTADMQVFADTASSDYRLMTGSLAINAGINDSIIQVLLPYNGNDATGGIDYVNGPRIVDGIVDLGAIESLDGPLPVKSSPLRGVVNTKGHTILSWSTYSELGNKGFQVQESMDGVRFINSHFVSSLSHDGNSTSTLQYTVDAGVLSGAKYYRFQQKDINGHTTSSNIVRLQANKAAFQLTAYPNPARNDIHLRVEGEMGSHPRIMVIDISGRVLKTQGLSGSDSKVDLSALASGIYFIKYVDDQQNSVIRVVKQ